MFGAITCINPQTIAEELVKMAVKVGPAREHLNPQGNGSRTETPFWIKEETNTTKARLLKVSKKKKWKLSENIT